jgi:transposase-like protein
MKKALKLHGRPEAITTDGLRPYGAAVKELVNINKQEVGRWPNGSRTATCRSDEGSAQCCVSGE